MMKPIIGLTPCFDDHFQSQWMLDEYVQLIQKAGGIPLILTYTKKEEDLLTLLNMVDGLLFTGGHDVNPDLYHQQRHKTVNTCDQRDQIETFLFQYALNNNMPMFGICRGEQFFNVMFGGDLIQDINSLYDTEILHRQMRPYSKPHHKAMISKDSPLYEIANSEVIEINSLHHQAINHLGDGLKTMAVSEDGLVEAIYYPGHPFLWGLQWHPEYDFKTNEMDLKIVKAFIEASISFHNHK